MDITNRTVFIAGATSGIGLELARRFAAAGSTVIAGGRRTDLLDKIAGEGLATAAIDVTDQASIARARDKILRSHPELDTIVTMAGVMMPEDLRDPAYFSIAEQTIDTNLLSGSSRAQPRASSHGWPWSPAPASTSPGRPSLLKASSATATAACGTSPAASAGGAATRESVTDSPIRCACIPRSRCGGSSAPTVVIRTPPIRARMNRCFRAPYGPVAWRNAGIEQ